MSFIIALARRFAPSEPTRCWPSAFGAATLFGLALIYSWHAAEESARAAEVTEYERGFIDQRKAIEQLVLEVDSECYTFRPGNTTRSKRTVWQDGALRRCDEMREVFDRSDKRLEDPYRLVAFEAPGPAHLLWR